MCVQSLTKKIQDLFQNTTILQPRFTQSNTTQQLQKKLRKCTYIIVQQHHLHRKFQTKFTVPPFSLTHCRILQNTQVAVQMDVYHRQTTLLTCRKICKKHKSMYIISKQHYLDVVQNLQKAEMDVYHRRTTLFSRSAAETDVAPI